MVRASEAKKDHEEIQEANAQSPNIELTEEEKVASFFGGKRTISTSLDRYGLGRPDPSEPDAKILTSILGTYLSTFQQVGSDGKIKLLHNIKPDAPIRGQEAIVLWGNYKLNEVLPSLVPGTRFYAKYLGQIKIGGGRTMNEIDIRLPEDAKRVKPTFVASDADDSTPF